MGRRAGCSTKNGARAEPDAAAGQGKGGQGEGRRIDKWLWYARVVKTRTLAASLVEAGRVRLNRVKVDKPKQIVKPGDVLTISVHHKVRVLKVVLAGERRGPASEAQTLFEDLTPPDVISSPSASAEAGVSGGMPVVDAGRREPGASRPTKRERRQIDRLRGR